MSIISFIGDHTLLFGVFIVSCFILYKWVLVPIMNEGKPIEPDEEDIKTFSEKMDENLNPNVDF